MQSLCLAGENQNQRLPRSGSSLRCEDYLFRDSLELVSQMVLRPARAKPSGLKPSVYAALGGPAEAGPYPKPIYETSSMNPGH